MRTRGPQAIGLPLLLVLSGLACGGQAPQRERGPFDVKRGEFRGFYRADGRLERLEQDANADGKPDAVILYRPDSKMQYAEIDSNKDGTMDRWEYFGTGGALEKIATSRIRPGTPDTWELLDPSGRFVVKREYDDNGDGRPDRTETVAAPPPGSTVQELDSDGDGRVDRRLVRGPAGEVVRLEVDPEQDGTWESRPVSVGAAASSR